MKKEKNLSKILYVFVVLSLVYTCYVMFQTYASYAPYLAKQAITQMQIIELVLSNMFVPLLLTVVLYALASINDMLVKHIEKGDMPLCEEGLIKSEEIVDKTQKA